MKTFLWSLRALLIAVFATAAIGKLGSNGGALATPILFEAGSWAHTPATIFEQSLPYIELLLALSLATGVGLRASAVITVGLSAVFLVFGMWIPEGARCTCFGLFGGIESKLLHVALTGGMALCAGWLAIAGHGRSNLHLPACRSQQLPRQLA